MEEPQYASEEGVNAVISCLDVKTQQHVIDNFREFELRCKFIKNFDEYFPFSDCGGEYMIYQNDYLPFVGLFKIADLTIEENTKLLMTHFYIGKYDLENDAVYPSYFDGVLFCIHNGVDVNFNFEQFDLISSWAGDVNYETVTIDKIILKRLLEAGDYDEKNVKNSLKPFVKWGIYTGVYTSETVLEITVLLDIIIEAM